MPATLREIQHDRRLMAYAAAGMYGAAGLDGLFEGFLPSSAKFSMAPVIGSVVMCLLLVSIGPKLPRLLLGSVGPIGAAFVAVAVGTTPGAGDGAVLYALPVMWTTLFFGRRGAGCILGVVAVGQALALIALPGWSSYPDRWVDVMVAAISIVLVILALQRHNEALLARWQAESRTDVLTGLLNRRGFHERARIELAHARREGDIVAVVSLDIDHFKAINDRWGHDAGDEVLQQVGRILASQVREIDVAGRVGGEEFVVLLPGCDAIQADLFTDRVRRHLETRNGEWPWPVRFSAGVAATLAPPQLEDLLRPADDALYAAKRGGRNQTIIAELDGSVAAASAARVGRPG